MFSAGESVVYGTHGVCVIDDVTVMPLGATEKEYYILSPVSDPKSTIYVPLDSEVLVSQMRRVLTAEQIDELISKLDSSSYDWIPVDSERKSFCQSILKSGDRLKLMNMIRMLYARQEELRNQKKHFHVADERFLKDACKLVHDEFSFVLGISASDVPAYIENKVKQTS